MKLLVSILTTTLLAAAPAAEPTAGRIGIRLDCALDTAGGISGELEITAAGSALDVVAGWIYNLPPADRRWAAGRFMEKVVPGAELLTGEVNTDKNSLRFSCRFRRDHFTIAARDRVLVPAILGAGMLSVAGLDELISTCDQLPFELVLEEVIRLPVGFAPRMADRATATGEDGSSFSGLLDLQSTAVSRTAALHLEPGDGELVNRGKALASFKHWRPDVVAERRSR